MPDYNERIKELESELRTTKYNKKTQHHIGLVKAKLAKIKDQQVSRGKGQKKGEGYSVRKSGDATVILVGYPSVGKSTLLNALTGAKSKVGAYEFTTLDVIPGVLEYNHAKIQLLDVPGIVRGAARGTGRGKEVLAVIRSADLALIIVDANQPQQLPFLESEIFESGIRLDQKKPDVTIKRTARGGLRIGKTVRLTRLETKTIEAILREFRINNADVLIRANIDADQLIDVIEGNRIYIPSLKVLNKIDTVKKADVPGIMKQIGAHLAISATTDWHIEELRSLIFERLGLIRVYLKEPGKKADMVEPLIMFLGCTITDICRKLHKDFVPRFRFVRLWGKSAKFPGQKLLKLAHTVQDEDVVELHLR